MDLAFSEVYKKKTVIFDDEIKSEPVIELEQTEIEPVSETVVELTKIDTERLAGSVEGIVTEELKIMKPEDKVYNDRKIRVTKLKVIVFDEIGKEPLSDYRDLRERDKKRFLTLLTKYDNEMSDEDIDKLFNEICIDTIFDYKKVDYSSLPIYNA